MTNSKSLKSPKPENNNAKKNSDTQKDNDTRNGLYIFGTISFAAFVGLIFYCVQFELLVGCSVFASAFILSLSASLVGGLVGFLFGIPKTLPFNPSDRKQPISGSNPRIYQANTNLEEVSDWLTKILLGIGLTQIPAILENLKALIDFLKPALGDKESSASLAICLITLFSINGFIYGYLRTRSEIPNFLRGEEQKIPKNSGTFQSLQNPLLSTEKESRETLGNLQEKQN